MSKVVVGIDVSKGKVDVCVLPGEERWSVEEDDYPLLADRLIPLSPDLVLLEATGGYETEVVACLDEAALPVMVVNPAWIRSYARAMGISAKTDRLDAFVLAQYAMQADFSQHADIPRIEPKLRRLLARRRQLVQILAAENNRSKMCRDELIRTSIEELLKTLRAQLRVIESEMDLLIAENAEMVRKSAVLESVPGVGKQTSRVLVTELPELGILDKRKIASVAGIAPMNQDSGKYKGERHIQGGRIYVRCALYMACLSAIRFNPVIKAYYRRLRESGKKPKVAIVACMRKLLIILNTLVKNNEKFQITS